MAESVHMTVYFCALFSVLFICTDCNTNASDTHSRNWYQKPVTETGTKNSSVSCTKTTLQPITLHGSVSHTDSFCAGIELCSIACKKLVPEKYCIKLTDTRASFCYQMTCTVSGTSFLSICRRHKQSKILNVRSGSSANRLCRQCSHSRGVGLKFEIHEIHQNLRNPVSTNRNPLPTTKSNSAERKLNIEIQRNRRKPLTNKRKQSSSGPKNRNPRNPQKRYEIQRLLIEINCLHGFQFSRAKTEYHRPTQPPNRKTLSNMRP